ncbi:MAG: radical SAM/SPASM domain-containing protein [Syntrophales bacterium]
MSHFSVMELNRNPYPKQIIVDIHSYCNAKCKICPYHFLKTKNPMGVMEEDLFIKIIDEFYTISKSGNFTGHVLFCNIGELFINPELAVDRIKYVTRKKFRFDIQTNAALLTPEVFNMLKETEFCGAVLVSFHGISPHVYKETMGLDIEKTMRNIDYLTQNYPKELIGIQSIPYNWPKGEAKRIRSYFRRKGIKVRMPLPNSRAGLLPQITEHKNRRLIGCTANRPLGEMVICFDGEVVLCCHDMGRQEIIGNVKKNTIQEVWNGEIMLNKISQLYCGKPSSENFICRKCEFGIASKSLLTRLIRNIRHETKKFALTHL